VSKYPHRQVQVRKELSAYIPIEPFGVFSSHAQRTSRCTKKQTLTHVLHHKLNAPSDAQKENTCSLSNEPLLAAHKTCLPHNPSLGPTELGHHLCDDRAHLGICLVLSKVGRIVHHWNQALKQRVKSIDVYINSI
jgi:hypothetical protein